MADNFNLEQMEQETEEMLRILYLTEKNAVFARTEGGFVSLEVEGNFYERVQVVRMFPYMEKRRFISIRTVNDRSKEIGIIEDLNKFNKETQRVLEEQLNLRYFTPVIVKVVAIKEEYGFAYWNVLTDHGECCFTIQMGGNAISHLSDSRILICDIDENRFEIPDVNKLSSSERKKLDLYL